MILSEEQEMVKDTAQRFARERLAPNSRAWEQAGEIPVNILQEMGELGLMGMTVPEQYGGAGLDYVSYTLALIEIAAGDAAVSTVMSVNNAPVGAILFAEASEPLKKDYLVPLARGEITGAFALTEPHTGSDASNLRTRAVKTAGGYAISGTKQFITSGRIAAFTIVFAVTDAGAGKRGISAFVVPQDSAGLQIARSEDKLGQNASDTCQLVFDNVLVGEELRLGAQGDGYRIALANLETGRIGIAAQSIGIAQAALGQALAYAKERQAFGKPIAEHQAVAFRLAEMATRLEAARALTLQAAALKDAGRPCLQQACMAKLFASEMAEKVCSAAIQCHGGYGYVKDFMVEKFYRDVRVCQIYEGTSDVQKMLISRQLLAN